MGVLISILVFCNGQLEGKYIIVTLAVKDQMMAQSSE
jgi:hypothetical protein